MDNSPLEHRFNQKPTIMAKATENKSAREVIAEQLGDAGLRCLAQNNVAASNAISSIECIEDIELDVGDNYEFHSKICDFGKAVRKQSPAIVEAYTSFREATERFAMVLQLSEMV